jgi:hypothetical protein
MFTCQFASAVTFTTVTFTKNSVPGRLWLAKKLMVAGKTTRFVSAAFTRVFGVRTGIKAIVRATRIITAKIFSFFGAKVIFFHLANHFHCIEYLSFTVKNRVRKEFK